jgi:ubiquinone/menaquinone biosynthesis C-methylase UbiE
MDELKSTHGSVVSRLPRVRQLFEAPEWYLEGTGFNIRIRQETVSNLVSGTRFDRILDIGCGSGAISIPLLRPDNRLTLVDVSSTMISIARSNIPAELAENVEFLNSDLMIAPLEPHSYDLIVCLGVLAHVESPSATLARIASLLRPGGCLILEFTDARHPIGFLNVLYNRLRGTLRPPGYSLNLLSHRDVFGMLKTNNLMLVSVRRYGQWFPLVHKLFSQRTLYKMVRAVFGTPQNSRNAFLGNAYICLVRG